MYEPQYSGQFKKDIKKIEKQGKDIEKLKTVVTMLILQKPLPIKYKDHVLRGNWTGFRELHIESDWLLIYKVYGNKIRFERTGSHSALFE